ncbi:MAG TPA: hypothetical protein PLP14_01910 [Chitinophagaceae bacterium]|nr:hypothetical protein [Chitinophagaceae bacterium]
MLGLSSFFSGQDEKKYPYTVYLSCNETLQGFLSKQVFDSVIQYPLCAKDSLKQTYQVQSFDMTYAERGLYQDSSGLPIVFTDYSQAQFTGNQFSPQWIRSFRERSYRGDTVYIENVKVLGPDNKSHACKGLKVIIR